MEKNLISAEDRIYAANAVCEALHIDDYDPPEENFNGVVLEPVLRELLEYAVEKGLTDDGPVAR
ncbi:MAG: galactose-1-phosphate uridylyltransferase, partial [Oscillospiraceae bacterium]|nr:galactose-1-phosphate uridylyltransferase [Oscillospiraceae bacterium]